MCVVVLCWIDHVWSSKEFVCCACDPNERLSAPSICFVCVFVCRKLSPKCAAITGVGVDMSPHCFIKGPNGSASYTASGSKV